MSLLVNLFIVGAQKSGTTALHHMLNNIPNIQMSKKKEVHFFDDDSVVDWKNVNYEKLHSQFDWSIPVKIRGEATPITCFWPNALERLKTYNPDAKLVHILRHPVYRAYSQWKMEYKKGNENLSFLEAISVPGQSRSGEVYHRVYSYLDRGYYDKIVEKIYNLFPKNHLILLRTDHLWNNPKSEVEKLLNFLEIAKRSDYAPDQKYIVPIDTRDIQNLSNELFRQLLPIFEQSINRLQAIANNDYSDWLKCEYKEDWT